MSTGSSIEWTDASWSPITGCTRVSEGCRHCYAERLTHRLSGMGQEKYRGLTVLKSDGPHWTGEIRCHEDELEKPLKWRKPRMIFVNSMSDTFHERVPFEFIDRIFAVMALTPQHTYQILTKRPERMAEYLQKKGGAPGRIIDAVLSFSKDYPKLVRAYCEACGGDGYSAPWPYPQVWLGASIEDQPTADARIPHLLRCPEAVRFVSYEPALGSVDWTPPENRGTNFNQDDWLQELHWIIVGGESGPGARPFDVQWARDTIRRCRNRTDMGRPWPMPCFLKQTGARPIFNQGDQIWMVNAGLCDSGRRDPKGGDPAEWPEDLRIREWPC